MLIHFVQVLRWISQQPRRNGRHPEPYSRLVQVVSLARIEPFTRRSSYSFLFSYVPDVKGFFESHAEKPAATMVCKSKLVRNKSMYKPEFAYTASLVKPEQVKSIKVSRHSISDSLLVAGPRADDTSQRSSLSPRLNGSTFDTENTLTLNRSTQTIRNTLPISPKRTERSSRICTKLDVETFNLTILYSLIS